MRVLAACSLGGAGHLDPLVPFLAAARRRGDDTLVVGPPGMRDLVGRTGFPFVAGAQPGEDEVAPIRERLPVAPPDEALVLGNRELFGRLAATAMVPAVERACAEWRPDLVLRDPCEYASAVVVPPLGIPAAQVAISLAEGEAASIDAAAPALEGHRPGTTGEVRASPYLTRFPASLDPSPFADTVRYHPPPPAPGPPLPDWWGGSDAPLVYLTFGTVLGHMSIAAGAYRTALRAVAGLDARVLLTVGRAVDPAGLGPVPDNVHVEAWVDQADVLASADLVACHGGSGTVLGALTAGVPLVVVPLFADQFENARRVAATGAGQVVIAAPKAGRPGRNPIDEGDAPQLASAIATVLATTGHRDQAERLAAEVAAAPPADEVLDRLVTARTG
jgi:UDP:flavonoid glycosyltransferase YjiC (YdhE family)